MNNRTLKRLILISFDTLAISGASLFAYVFLNPYIALDLRSFSIITVVIILSYIALAFKLRIFDKINRFTSIKETVVHGAIVTASYIFSTLVVTPFRTLSLRYVFLSFVLAAAAILGSRIVWRIYIEHKARLKKEQEEDSDPIRVLIVGGGLGGSIFIKGLRNNPSIELIGVVDDDENKQKTTIYGSPVLGKVSNIQSIVQEYAVEQVTIAIPSLKQKDLGRIYDEVAKTDAKLNKMPPVEGVISGKYEVSQFKEIDVTDLLGREEVKLEMERISDQLSGQTVLVSGAGGSIGSEICRQIARFSPKRLILLGHGEYSIYLINRELNQYPDRDFEIIPVIADIQDRERIFEVMERYKPDRVYHAAAHKHVPLMEYNPTESVKNNIYGTKNMAEAAKAASVGHFVMVSTDKAVNPPNVMGATKRIAEMIVTGLNEKGKTNFVAVRFGNVLNSRGSVVPVFKEQIKKGGPITVTDFRMTRYFMTIPEASRLVLQAGSLAKGGEIFVLDMGTPVKIVDLARQMIRLSGHSDEEIEIRESGIRPGEKLYEELLTTEESTEEKVYEKIFVGKVNNLPLDKVLYFVEQLEGLEHQKLKEALIDFANDKYNKEDITNFEIQEKIKNIAIAGK